MIWLANGKAAHPAELKKGMRQPGKSRIFYTGEGCGLLEWGAAVSEIHQRRFTFQQVVVIEFLKSAARVQLVSA